MFKHHIKIALRNMTKQKALTFINVFGLSAGLACFSLFLLYAVNEFSFDRFHANADNIYRVVRWSEGMNDMPQGGDSYMPMPLGPAMKNDLPGVKNFVRIKESWGESFIKVNNEISKLDVTYADPQFFSVFSFKLLHGDTATALKDMKSVVVTEDAAMKLFGGTNVVGRTIEVKSDSAFEPFVVTAVAENCPANSSINFEILANWSYLETTKSGKRSIDNWQRSGYQTYVQLQPGSGLPGDKTLLANFRAKYYPDELSDIKSQGQWKGNYDPVSFRLQSLKDIHTNTNIEGGSVAPVNVKNIWILMAIAAGVLLIACINFTTLAIGRSAGRAKEVGVRKVIGSDKRKLVFQFLTEAVLLTIISAGLGFLLAELLLPYFNKLSDRDLQFSFTAYPEITWLFAGLIVLVGLLAGSYPALVLSGFKPVEVLKSKVRVSGSNIFTKSLVTVQFVVSVVLIISTVIVLQQVSFMRNTNPGFNKENVVMIDGDETDTKKIFPIFKQAVSSNTDVLGVAASELGLGAGTGWSRSGFEYKGKHKDVYEYFVDANYINVMGMKLTTGRNFDPSVASDTQTAVIINETMARDFGWTNETAIGQQLTGYSESFTPVVIGVIKDFHFRPFSEKVGPQMFHQFSDYVPLKLFVRIKPGNPSKAIAAMQEAWKQAEPVLPFKYTFLDESLSNFYKEEDKWSNIIGWAGSISVFLACLGLFGLAALAAVNRTKEIGIRKVLGASVPGIINLLSKDFLKLIVLAVLIASPIAWLFMNKALQNFAYHINISVWVFVAAGVAALLTALATVAVQAIKAAKANPVQSLRAE